MIKEIKLHFKRRSDRKLRIKISMFRPHGLDPNLDDVYDFIKKSDEIK